MAKVITKGSSKKAFDSNRLSAWSVSQKNSEALLEFPNETEINALLLNEIGHNTQRFSVYYANGENWTLCYRQNEIGINRLATFYPVKTNKVKIVIEDFKNVVRINDIKIYNIAARKRQSDLRVTSYITPNSLKGYDPVTNKSAYVDGACFDVVTDVQFIAYGRFQEDGSIKPEETSVEMLAVLNQMIGSRPVNIFLTIFPPLAPYYIADVYFNYMDNAVKSVADLVNECDVYGVDFDWEYPSNAKEYEVYSEYLVKLKQELAKNDKKLSLALSPWGLKFSQEAIDAIDQVQLMAYDLFDHNGDNNSYAGSSENCIAYMLNKGFSLSQLNLGISYYGRPNDGGGKWYNFNSPDFVPDEYIMFQKNSYFNTPTTVRDKTVYALLRGIGGIMTFAQDEDLPMDNPLSLTYQIGKAKQTFSIREN